MTYWFLPSRPSILIIKSWLQVYTVSLTVVYFKMWCMENNLHQNPLEVQLIMHIYPMVICFACIWIPVKFWLREKLLAKKKKYADYLNKFLMTNNFASYVITHIFV